MLFSGIQARAGRSHCTPHVATGGRVHAADHVQAQIQFHFRVCQAGQADIVRTEVVVVLDDLDHPQAEVDDFFQVFRRVMSMESESVWYSGRANASGSRGNLVTDRIKHVLIVADQLTMAIDGCLSLPMERQQKAHDTVIERNAPVRLLYTNGESMEKPRRVTHGYAPPPPRARPNSRPNRQSRRWRRPGGEARLLPRKAADDLVRAMQPASPSLTCDGGRNDRRTGRCVRLLLMVIIRLDQLTVMVESLSILTWQRTDPKAPGAHRAEWRSPLCSQ